MKVKLWVYGEALNWVLNSGFQDVIFECDSEEVLVDAIHSKYAGMSEFNVIIS